VRRPPDWSPRLSPIGDTRPSDGCVSSRYDRRQGRADALDPLTAISPSRQPASGGRRASPRPATTPPAAGPPPHARRTTPHRAGRADPCPVRRRPLPFAAARDRDDVVSDHLAGTSDRCEPPKPVTGASQTGQPLSATDMPPLVTLSSPFPAGLRQLAAGRGRSLPVCKRSWTVERRLPPVRHHCRPVRHRYRPVRHRCRTIHHAFRAVRHRLRPIVHPFDVSTHCFRRLRIDSRSYDPRVGASTTRLTDATQLRNR
jgi:hypothetical protein